MLRDSFYYDCPEEQIDPPYEPCRCDECGERIQPDEDAGEIRGLFPRILCKDCAERRKTMASSSDGS